MAVQPPGIGDRGQVPPDVIGEGLGRAVGLDDAGELALAVEVPLDLLGDRCR